MASSDEDEFPLPLKDESVPKGSQDAAACNDPQHPCWTQTFHSSRPLNRKSLSLVQVIY